MSTGGNILISRLAIEGIRHVFMVPGESFIAALDALHDETCVSPVTCRNEAGAAMMAEATGKLTGRPGVALVTRGPGAANALAGVYIAHQDATPMILLVGLPPRASEGVPAFQAFDIEAVFASVSKWCAVIPSADRLQDYLVRAFKVAMSGRSGPVVLGIPEDVFSEVADVPVLARTTISRDGLSAEKLHQIQTLLAQAERPVVIVGGSDWSADTAQALAVFAQRFDLPVIAAFRRQDRLDNRHKCYVGHAGLTRDPSLDAGLRAADVIIAIGTRLGDITSKGFSLIDTGAADKTLIHIAPDATAPDTMYPFAWQMSASAPDALRCLADMDVQPTAPRWRIWRRDLRAAYLASQKPNPTSSGLSLDQIVVTLSDRLEDTALVCSGAGNYAAFVHRFFAYKGYPSQLAPVSGSMGYGLPAAIAAKLAFPERTVVAVAGDGCFQMISQELATAVQYGLPLVIIVANNGALGTIRMHQERRYPRRVVATSLINPDFVTFAESFGAWAKAVCTASDFEPTLEAALMCGRPALIELKLDVETLSPTETISSIRAQAAKNAT